MPDICPTITVETRGDYDRQLYIASSVSGRVHIDLADGTLAPRRLLNLREMNWPEGLIADLHIMSNKPAEIAASIKLTNKPHLVVVHAEADGDFFSLAYRLKRHDIKVGVALLPSTAPEIIKPALDVIDHVLIFSGNFGYQGGSTADLSLLGKVKSLKTWKPELEIGWDGGVNEQNILSIVAAGVDVVNVGGYIQLAEDPQEAYAKLTSVLDNKNAS